jgi:hypothetical protein
MKKLLPYFLLLLTVTGFTTEKNKVYLFSYFKGNGEDGLHLAYSRDGMNFKILNNDNPFQHIFSEQFTIGRILHTIDLGTSWFLKDTTGLYKNYNNLTVWE